MARWLVAGAGGMLGTDLVSRLGGEGGEHVVALGRADLDIVDARAVREAVMTAKPDIVVNCAAWTLVDEAETREEEAQAVNGDAVQEIALACAELGARLIQPSTDYVFSGTAREPYREDGQTGPLNAYGRTKLAGERAVLSTLPDSGFVVRTAWLYGGSGRNFVRTIISLAGERETLDVVDDQRGQPTWTDDLAAGLIRLARSDAAPGVYHATSSGETTWYGLAREIFTLLGADPDRVRPVSSAAYTRAAVRPPYSVLGHARWAAAGLEPMREWREALRQAWPVLVGTG
ncbi:dTDP-4-dehydrorhamnose reductase [Planomonospora sp. ID67723]|uniref:dTDP-4-dehydrorhamnose reductase n=1 Tax=Planomonospora sp. ID67723 TaxID=2738134 RepID=UPI0018C3F826|nr:dTDP-4-dehydrorhamnose reductase [Planomonospora sp. ID67723]MBG0827430.1 dTDP-4-dehydrorhamnose reductase [Planomonospora sp. ID67723]